MKIAVRLDDITPDMDWERFFRFKTLLDRYQVKPLIGVIPDNRDESLRGKGKDLWRKEEKEKRKKTEQEKAGISEKEMPPEDFWEYVKDLERGGWVIAMHGCHHVYATKKGGLFPLNDFSEFAGLPLEQQRALLAEGKKRLEEKGIRTEIFMAPAHSYDRNTLRALRETGFRALTDGFGAAPYRWKGLDFYPISFRLSSTFKQKKGYSTMVVHPGTVSEKDLERYEGYFRNQSLQWISFEEYLNQPRRKRNSLGRCREWIMAKGKYFMVKAGGAV